MTSSEIRQSFLDFFAEKQHTIVASSSLLPDSPGLLFTNAGMNQFVPIFLNEIDCPYSPARAADTQKCIRAGGKHNDLEDVGFDTYHHTFFEMLGNWSFGDYFKKEAIEWSWELLTEHWKFPKERLYATVYKPESGDPASFDQEAYDFWKAIFEREGLDPDAHIIYGNKKDNFWMMGDTGPCGPCSELHMDLTPEGDTKGTLVNQDDARCIEIWNLVFIQFNANADGTFSDLPAKHVDTGMGFERVCSIMQGTKGFTDFSIQVSNYSTDVFSPIFKELESLSGLNYEKTMPDSAVETAEPGSQIATDIAMRVIADHIRTLSLSAADGILPGNEGRNYVLRRILRRAVRYGRQLGLNELFFYKLVPVLVRELGSVFPELIDNQAVIERVIKAEEESFSRTLDRGIDLFNQVVDLLPSGSLFPGEKAFELYDTYGFPVDLTELMAKEKGIQVDLDEFESHMNEQRERSRAAQKKEIIAVKEKEDDLIPTSFEGFDSDETNVEVLTYKIDMPEAEGDTVRARLYLSPTPFYAEMGGQVGDTGVLEFDGETIEIINTLRSNEESYAHITEQVALLDHLGFPLKAKIDRNRRSRIEAHHSATHILHWALREVLGKTVSQKGSYVGPDRLRFDFSHMEAMKPAEFATVEKLVNERIENASAVKWDERPYAEVKKDDSIIQFFGDKYGEIVRVVDIGGFSKELCGGTHVRNTTDIGTFRLISEGAIAAGVRRIEAACGPAILDYLESVFRDQRAEFQQLEQRLPEKSATQLAMDTSDPESAWANYLSNQDLIETTKVQIRDWEKEQAKARQSELLSQAAKIAPEWAKSAEEVNGVKVLLKETDSADGKLLQSLLGELKKHFNGISILAGGRDGKVALAVSVPKEYTNWIKAGDVIKEIAPIVGGKGGGKPELAQGGGQFPEKINDALDQAKEFIAKQKRT
ncbi:MAG: alanine--tRNA ligase [Verrucomicrobiota bacterium]